MRQIYSRSFTATLASGGSRYVFAEKIDPGNILHVHSCSAYSLQREASDNVIIGIRNGGEDLILTAQAPLAIQRGVDAPNSFFVGEGDQAFGYFPDGDDTDTIGIHLNGVLIPLSEWVKEAE
jgi:hypothetical protein